MGLSILSHHWQFTPKVNKSLMGRGRGALLEVPSHSFPAISQCRNLTVKGEKVPQMQISEVWIFPRESNLARAPRNEEGELNSARKQGLT